MIIKNNYLYTNTDTGEAALGGTDVLLTGFPADILLAFMSRNAGRIVDKYVSVMPDEWDNTPKEPLI